MIHVLLVDDHAVLRTGLKALLSAQPDMAVVGEAEDARLALRFLDQNTPNLPDIVVTDISMPGLNGLEGLRKWLHFYPELKVLVLSMHANREYIIRAFQFGAKGYMLKQADAGEVITAIQTIMKDGFYVSPEVPYDINPHHLQRAAEDAPASLLTAREREVAQLIGEGQSTRQIAETLYISIKTAETHRTNLMKKLKANHSADVVKYAIKKGWVSLE